MLVDGNRHLLPFTSLSIEISGCNDEDDVLIISISPAIYFILAYAEQEHENLLADDYVSMTLPDVGFKFIVFWRTLNQPSSSIHLDFMSSSSHKPSEIPPHPPPTPTMILIKIAYCVMGYSEFGTGFKKKKKKL